MKLRNLLFYNDIVIQGHDNPDADAIASSFGLYSYFKSHDKNVRIIYGGENEITKSNLIKMIDLFDIPLEHVTEMDSVPELLITADCQYGERNVQRFEAKEIAVIDHHMVKDETLLPKHKDVRSNYGSCSTIVWDLLLGAGFNVMDDEKLCSALFYGLYMDTNRMQELRHPKDRDLRDTLEFNISQADVGLLENTNLSAGELRIAGNALSGFELDQDKKFAIVEASECDPNILGIISDALIEVDDVDSCAVFCRLKDGIKLSVRSCVKGTRADELAAFLCEHVGSGGGNRKKAGGFISIESLEAMGLSENDFIKNRIEDFFSEQEVIISGKTETCDLSDYPLYKKLPLPIGYVKATDMYPEGTKVTVRMLEGEMPVTIRNKTYFVIGVEHEVYINDEDYFWAHNDKIDEPYVFSGEYEPTLCKAVDLSDENRTFHSKKITDYVKCCRPKETSFVRSKVLDRRTKVVVPWSDNYMTGIPGDYLVARAENPKDVYIVKKDVMEKSYEMCVDERQTFTKLKNVV